LIVELTLLCDAVAGTVDGIGFLGRQMAEPPVDAGRRLLDQSEGPDEIREMPDGNAGDGKILDVPKGVDAPLSLGGNVGFTEKIVFAAGSDLGQEIERVVGTSTVAEGVLASKLAGVSVTLIGASVAECGAFRNGPCRFGCYRWGSAERFCAFPVLFNWSRRCSGSRAYRWSCSQDWWTGCR